jgi:hypothetical protein
MPPKLFEELCNCRLFPLQVLLTPFLENNLCYPPL